jgi:hypothetical protein
MLEAEYLTIPKKSVKVGVKNRVLISKARGSGIIVGTTVLHIKPEVD